MAGWTIAGAAVLAAQFAAAAPAHPEAAWSPEGNDAGVRLWSRPVPQSELLEVRGQKLIGAPPARVWQAIDDYGHYPQFMPYMVRVERFQIEANGYLQYVLSAPPVISARDYVARGRNAHDVTAGVYVHTFESIEDPRFPVRSDAVRVARLVGSWRLEPRPGGATLATYTYYCDPGGWVPAVAVNLGTRQTVAPILLAVEKRAMELLAADRAAAATPPVPIEATVLPDGTSPRQAADAAPVTKSPVNKP